MSALNIATSALNTNMAALQVIGHNISNANTEGYSRQTVQLQQIPGQKFGNGYFGKGVEMASVARSYDAFLTRDANVTRAQAAADSVRYDRLQQLEQVFPTGETGLGAQLNGFLNAWADVVASPADLTARAVVLSRAEEMVGRFQQTTALLEEQGTTTLLQMNHVIEHEINARAQQLAGLNQKIAEATAIGGGASPNDLLDQRDRVLNELNQYVKTTTLAADDGTMTVFIAGSYPLVMGSMATPLLPPTLDANGKMQIAIGTASASVDYTALGGGELQGLLRFYNEDLASAQSDLDALAWSVADQVNKQHVQGFDLQGNPGTELFQYDSAATSPYTGAAKNLKVLLSDPSQLAVASSAPPAFSKYEAGNAQAMLNLRDTTVPDLGNYSLSDGYIYLFNKVASNLLAAKSASALSSNVAAAAEQSRANQSGVNLDEEAARLLQFQQAYQASAKYLQTVQSVFDTLVRTFGG